MPTANPADAVREALERLGENIYDKECPAYRRLEIIRQHIAQQDAEIARLCEIAGYGGVSADAPPRLILASEMFDGLKACDKWCDVRRVVDDGQPMPESATAYVRADLAALAGAAPVATFTVTNGGPCVPDFEMDWHVDWRDYAGRGPINLFTHATAKAREDVDVLATVLRLEASANEEITARAHSDQDSRYWQGRLSAYEEVIELFSEATALATFAEGRNEA